MESDGAESAGLWTGEQCRAMRLACGRTLREASEDSGIHLVEICAFERGRRKFSPVQIERLQKALELMKDVPRRELVRCPRRKRQENPVYRRDLEESVTARERRVFRHRCCLWNASGLRKLNGERFARAVTLVLRNPRLYAPISPGATFSDREVD